MTHLGPLLIIAALATPATMLVKGVGHHRRQRSAVRAWEKELRK
jgi:hypothetical protein